MIDESYTPRPKHISSPGRRAIRDACVGTVVKAASSNARHSRRADAAQRRHKLRIPYTRACIVLADWLTPNGDSLRQPPSFTQTLRSLPHWLLGSVDPEDEEFAP